MTIRDQKNSALDSAIESMQNKDTEKFKESMISFGQQLQSEIMEQATTLTLEQSNDARILAQRGVRQLTSEENKFYEKVVEALKSANPKEALTKLDVAFPETIVNEVFDAVRAEHPLLKYVDLQNASITNKYLSSKGTPKCKFGALGSEITQELSAELAMVEMDLMKMSAFIPVSKDFLELGMGWIDRFVRELLVKSIGNGLEDAILNNLNTATGPISMRADLSTGSPTKGSYGPSAATTYTTQTKTKNKIKDLSVKTIGALLAKLSKDDDKKTRKVVNPFIVCSYTEYYSKFSPATSILNPMTGQYMTDVLPHGVHIIPSEFLADGEAIIGIGNQYALGVGIGTKASEGRPIEVDDSVKFLEDQRVYKIKGHANGFPKDNSSFILLDTTELNAEVALPIDVKGEVTTKASA